jgi:hypothetical protein
MKLLELDPRWLMADKQRIGFAFRVPTRLQQVPHQWQTCFFAPTPRRVQIMSVQRAKFGKIDGWAANVQLCNETCGWALQNGLTLETATFENMSVMPSLDGSAGGNWHGYITNGEIC